VREKARIILQSRDRQTDNKFTVLDFVILVVRETCLKLNLDIRETCLKLNQGVTESFR